MNERINRSDYRTIVQSLAIIRLQGWLLRRLATADMLDDAALVERLADIDRQTSKINDVLNTIYEISPAPDNATTADEAPS